MRNLVADDLRAKGDDASKQNGENGKHLTLERVRRFQEADQKLQEACARLGISKPSMMS